MRQYTVAAVAAALMVAAGELIIAAPPASAGCLDPGWAPHPNAQMCDSPIDSEGMWERCLTFYPNGPLQPDETDCYTMSPGQPPPGDPILGNPPTHIDP